MMLGAMHPAYASRITVAQMPNVVHVRTNELTYADAYLQRELILRLSTRTSKAISHRIPLAEEAS